VGFCALFALLLPHIARGDDDGPGVGSSDTPAGFGGSLPYQGKRIQMLGHLNLSQLGLSSGLGSAIWGWTDYGAAGGPREYALYGLADKTSFIDITNPYNPQLIGYLPTATGSSVWRELRTYGNHAFIVSDGNGAHGMQVFDLTKLRENSGVNYGGSAIAYSTTPSSYYTRYTGTAANPLSNSHTIHINESTGRAYLFGTGGASGYSGGVYTVDVTNPMSPTHVGGYTPPTNGGTSRYVHDGQAVIYNGPDAAYVGREILFAANARSSSNTADDTVSIVDLTNTSSPALLGAVGHADARYIHQGWLTPDHRYFIVNDELDEYYNVTVMKTHVFDVSDLDNPVYKGGWVHPHNSRVIDHNLFIRQTPYGLMAFESNYTMGLRVIRLDDLSGLTPQMTEFAWFDTYPADDGIANFNGQWGNYPFFDSGIIIAGDRQNGLFILSMVPEPSTWALLLAATLGLAIVVYRRRRLALPLRDRSRA
jgi:choice-of-anchor B domain-containing protein